NGWWGEGDEMIFVDDESKPAINGTGSEDYFLGSWDFGGEFGAAQFAHAQYGAPLIENPERTGGRYCCYRWHGDNPVTFERYMKHTMEHGHANDRGDNFYSAAYWYQDAPYTDFPALPPVGQRIAVVKAGEGGGGSPAYRGGLRRRSECSERTANPSVSSSPCRWNVAATNAAFTSGARPASRISRIPACTNRCRNTSSPKSLSAVSRIALVCRLRRRTVSSSIPGSSSATNRTSCPSARRRSTISRSTFSSATIFTQALSPPDMSHPPEAPQRQRRWLPGFLRPSGGDARTKSGQEILPPPACPGSAQP